MTHEGQKMILSLSVISIYLLHLVMAQTSQTLFELPGSEGWRVSVRRDWDVSLQHNLDRVKGVISNRLLRRSLGRSQSMLENNIFSPHPFL